MPRVMKNVVLTGMFVAGALALTGCGGGGGDGGSSKNKSPNTSTRGLGGSDIVEVSAGGPSNGGGDLLPPPPSEESSTTGGTTGSTGSTGSTGDSGSSLVVVVDSSTGGTTGSGAPDAFFPKDPQNPNDGTPPQDGNEVAVNVSSDPPSGSFAFVPENVTTGGTTGTTAGTTGTTSGTTGTTGSTAPNPPAVPEPATAGLALLGLCAMLLPRRRG